MCMSMKSQNFERKLDVTRQFRWLIYTLLAGTLILVHQIKGAMENSIGHTIACSFNNIV